MRIAMWSGPRNLSTAMMYSFGSRADFAVMDEPFYAAFLARTGDAHPMAAEILAAHETDPNRVGQMCTRSGAPHLYMKHMPHHMLEGFPMGWADGMPVQCTPTGAVKRLCAVLSALSRASNS